MRLLLRDVQGRIEGQFAKALHTSRTLTGKQESNEKTVTLLAEEQPYIEGMLFFLYSFRIPGKQDRQRHGFLACERKRSIHHIDIISLTLILLQLYRVADEYIVPNLKIEAKHRFGRDVDASSKDFHDIVDFVYASTPEADRGLRDIVVQAAIEHFRQLAQHRSNVKTLGDLMGIPEFASDFLAAEASCHELIANESLRFGLICCVCKRGLIGVVATKSGKKDKEEGSCPICGTKLTVNMKGKS